VTVHRTVTLPLEVATSHQKQDAKSVTQIQMPALMVTLVMEGIVYLLAAVPTESSCSVTMLTLKLLASLTSAPSAAQTPLDV